MKNEMGREYSTHDINKKYMKGFGQKILCGTKLLRRGKQR
jgi:hypothetical protein